MYCRPILTSWIIACYLCLPGHALAQYGDDYYKKYLPSIRSAADAVAALGRIVEKLPANERAAFQRSYLGFSLEPPNNGQCNMPNNLAGVTKINVERSDGKNIELYLCREQIVFATESITTLWLVMVTLSDLPDVERDRIMEGALAQTSASTANLFDTYKRRGSAYLCYPAAQAYALRRGGNAQCWGEDPQIFAHYMAPLLRKALPDITEISAPSDIELYFGMADMLQRDIGKWIVLFVMLHEVGHIVHGHTDDGNVRDVADNEAQADRYAFAHLSAYLGDEEKLIAGPALLLTQLHLLAVATLFATNAGKITDPVANTRLQAAAKVGTCNMQLALADPQLPVAVKRLLERQLKTMPSVACK